MIGELANRRQELIDARELCESALRAISQQLPVPDLAQSYLRSSLGADGSMLQGNTASDQIRAHLKYIAEQLKAIPWVDVRPVANRVQTTGRDLSQYKVP